MRFSRFLMQRFLPVVLSLSLLIGLMPAELASAAGINKLYVTPDSSQMNVGTSFVVNIRSYSTSSTGSVKGTLLYAAGSLKVTSISIADSAYGTPTITQGNGTIGFNGTRTPASGTAQIFAVTFLATAANNEATVGFSGDSKLNNTTTTYGQGKFVITNPPAPSPSPSPSSSTSTKPSTKPNGGGSGGSSSNSSTKPVYTTPVPIVTTPTTPVENTTTENTEPLAVVDPTGVVESVNPVPSYTSATITWRVTAPSPTSSLSYGSSTQTLDQQATVQNKGGGNFSATLSNLNPGQKYYFSITGNGSGVSPGTYTSSVQASGFPVVINVTENKVIAKGAQVQIGATNYVTRADGKVTIGLAAGSYSGKITTETATLNINLTVSKKDIPTDGSQPESQSFSFDLASSVLDNGPGTTTSVFTFIGVLIGGGAILVLGFLVFINYRRHKFDSGDDSIRYGSSAGPGVIIQDGYDWQQSAATEAPEDQQPLPPPMPNIPDVATPSNQGSSIYMSEEEPLDMFEQDRLAHQATGVTPQSETEQNPSSPHSTTL